MKEQIKFNKTESGVMVPEEKSEPKTKIDPDLPVLDDWRINYASELYSVHGDEKSKLIKELLTKLYQLTDQEHRGCGIKLSFPEEYLKTKELLNRLSLDLMGGIPSIGEEYC